MKTLSMHELNESLKNLSPQDLILDVRTPEEFAEGHVPGAANIPVDQVIGHAGELKKISKYLHLLPRGSTCRNCVRYLIVDGSQQFSRR